MNRVVWLPLDRAKCAGHECKRPGRCAAREVAADKGRPMTDYSRSPGAYMSAPCSAPNWLRWLDVATAVKPADVPTVKEWVGQ